MKKLLRILLIFTIGVVLGWVFNDVIDEKMNNKIGKGKTNEVKKNIKEKTENGAKNLGKAAKAFTDELKKDSSKSKE